MKPFFSKLILLAALLLIGKNNLLIAQDTYNVTKTLKKINIVNIEFEAILDSLLKKEQQCSYYKESLIWSVSFTQLKDDEYAISITMQTELSEQYKYLGYFHIGKVLFVLSGPHIHKDFFTECSTKQKFTTKNMKMPQIEDYSTWLYGYKGKTLFLRESFPLPCD
ncbi:MAG: hypothetical protein M9892_09790 [Bacteroidetes bacterium]|nr:hypothetical protein [Bacteroidota bacterium]